ncbi:hypothetical protein Fot_35152 [Forsythia ovata]|uniref:Uncharacterized protein n=1 Tax=Forsythia ovata TaxID=205694 RepID=A0ABD1SKP9_9LAMI
MNNQASNLEDLFVTLIIFSNINFNRRKKKLAAATTSASKATKASASAPLPKGVIINEPSAHKSTQPTLPEVVSKGKAPADPLVEKSPSRLSAKLVLEQKLIQYERRGPTRVTLSSLNEKGRGLPNLAHI